MRRTLSLSAASLVLLALASCSGSGESTLDDAGASQTTGGTNAGSGGGPGQATGGTTQASGGAVAVGGSAETGGSPASGGAPVDCSGIAAAGFELCSETGDSCGAVFTDGSGCSEVCAAAGLKCEAAYENLEDSCGADESRPALACDSGHQSDYCSCRGASTDGTGGASGSGGSGGTGTGGDPGTGGTTSAPDCNDVSNQPVIVVAKNGSGDFQTVQAAINSISAGNTTPTQIRIVPGTYKEKLVVNRPNITLCGQTGQTESTILTYDDNAGTSNGNGGTLGTSGSTSVQISASDVSAENITFENSTGPGIQAVALLITGSRVQFRNCRALGYQDTLYVKSGSQYFKDCYVEGSVDFIFGGATAVFENCTMHNASGGSAITAPSTEQTTPYGIVFLGGEATAASSVQTASVALGRNWHAYGATAYLGTVLGKHISDAGWSPMGQNTLATARFSEHETSGPGAKPAKRAPESKQLTDGEAAAYTVENILAPWQPTFAE